ncbi:MAG: hypothetical protein RR846_05100, partial [Oscillospiraceae bacterium]
LSVAAVKRGKEIRAVYSARQQEYHSLAQEEKKWLATTQLSNGALAKRPKTKGKASVVPYFSAFAAQALMDGDEQEEYRQAVKKYMDWHFAHLNDEKSDINGLDATIYNYDMDIEDGKVAQEISTGEYDSTDSYGAVFLSLAYRYGVQYKDKEYLQQHSGELMRIARMVLSTIDNGLSFAKPDYKIKYLMDNSEVYAGLRDMALLISLAELDSVGSDREEFAALKKALEEAQQGVASGISNMWDDKEGYYHPALGEKGGEASEFSWDNFYPSATSQVFPVVFGAASPLEERSKLVYSGLCSNHSWQTMESYHKDKNSFYWSILAYAAACMGDEERVNTYLQEYIKQTKNGHKSPVYNSDSAWMIMTCEYMAKVYSEKPIGISDIINGI